MARKILGGIRFNRRAQLLQRRITIQRLIKLQLRDRLCIRTRTRISHQPIVPGFCC